MASLAGKKAELEYWKNKCSAPILLEKLSDIIFKVWKDKKASFLIPTVSYDGNGQAKLGEWEVSPLKQMEMDVLIRASPLIGLQIGSIIGIRHRAMNNKIQKKWDVAKQADIEMADMTKPSLSIQSLINKGLNASLTWLLVRDCTHMPHP